MVNITGIHLSIESLINKGVNKITEREGNLPILGFPVLKS